MLKLTHANFALEMDDSALTPSGRTALCLAINAYLDCLDSSMLPHMSLEDVTAIREEVGYLNLEGVPLEIAFDESAGTLQLRPPRPTRTTEPVYGFEKPADFAGAMTARI